MSDANKIMAYLESRTDASVRQIAETTGIQRALVVKLVSQLKQQGKVKIAYMEDGVPYFSLASNERPKLTADDLSDYQRGYNEGFKEAINKMRSRLTELNRGITK